VTVRKRFKICCTFDHRVADGATMGKMARVVRRLLEDEPESLFS